MLLIYLSAAWLAGIFTGSIFFFPWQGIALAAAASLLASVAWRHPKLLALAGWCLVALLLGNARYQASLPQTGPQSLAFYNSGSSLELRGWVSGEPLMRGRTTSLPLAVTEVRADGQWKPVSGTALLIVPPYPERSYGERLHVVGRAQSPKPLGDFDYPAYLARQGIYSVLLFPRVNSEGQEGLAPWRWLLSFKGRLSAILSQSLPEPQAALAQGILLGLRAAIPKDLMEAFNRSGTTHIIVISGYNVSLVAGYLLLAGQPLVGRRRALWLSLAGISAYTALVGANPPVVRAAIMGGIFVLGTYLGRRREVGIALLLAGAAMTAFQPSLLWDVSFQLSFAATAGLVFVSPIYLSALQSLWPPPAGASRGLGLRAHRFLLENLSVTLGSTTAILPLLLVDFQRLPLLSPLANLLALPILPGIMLAGALTGGMGLLWLPLAQPAGWAAWLFLSYMIKVVEFIGALPVASLELPGFEPGLALAYYALLALALLWWPLGKQHSRD